jgi:tetratricopeptide (TPR) repeat protein
LLAEGAQLLDRVAEPRRWAAFRSRYASLSEDLDPPAAAVAYRDALEVWDPQSERESWLACHEGIGWLLARQAPLTPAQQQEAIEHLECAVGERPYLAAVLARLYQFHTRLECIAAGDLAQVEPLLAHGHAALALLSAPEALRDRRVVRQVIADGLLLAGRYEQAAATLRAALADATTALAAASSVAGRMERIWEFRDSAALLAHCLLRLGRSDEALLALDRGKALFWRTDHREWSSADLASLVPPGGALLCANFAADPGAVTIVAASGNETVWLPHFGRQRLLQLQRGDTGAAALGGWLLAYHQQQAQAAAWRQMIDDTGRVLYDEIWRPLLQRLPALGVAADGELVWLHQGGSSVFPLHAAWYTDDHGERHWLLDAHVIRYAPSIGALLAARPASDGGAQVLLVADPLRDLPFAAVECDWVQQALATPATLLCNDEATPAAVLAALGRVDILHLATHARFDLERPLQSCVFLAGGERLTIEALLPALAGRPPRCSPCRPVRRRWRASPRRPTSRSAFPPPSCTPARAACWPRSGR